MVYRFLLFAIVFFAVASSFGQEHSCRDLKTGKYEITEPLSGTTTLKRTASEQRERNEKLGYDVIFSIVWTDECTYELRPKKLIKGDPIIMGDGNNVIYNTITQISSTQYVVAVTTNFFPETFWFTVDRK